MDNKTAYKVLAFQLGQTKNGKEMWRISLQSIIDDKPLTGVIWSEDIPRFDGAKFKTGNIIRFLGQDYNSNYNSVVIKNVTVIKEALSGLPKVFADKYLKDINEYLDTIKIKYRDTDKAYLIVLAEDISKQINTDTFNIAPAAVKYHHNYIGGLLKHTYEVWQISKKLSEMFKIELADELQLAAILHDLGKMYEYDTDLKLGTAAIDEAFIRRELSHTHWGFRFAHDCGAFDIARMVACHHGRIEWGALFEPETPEEKALHSADMLSASIGIISIDKLEAQYEAILKAKAEKEKEEEKKEEEENVCTTSSDVL